MSSIIVHGPAPPLRGRLTVPGAKNAGLPILTVAALAGGSVTVTNVPALTDIAELLAIFRDLGCDVRRDGSSVRITRAHAVRTADIPPDRARRLRGSIYAIVLPLASIGSATTAVPGGDQIAGRTLAPHARAVAGFGMEMRIAQGRVSVTGGPPRPSELVLDDEGTTATGIAVMLAASCDGRSVIRNASMEPENDDILDAIAALGGEIARDGRTIIVRGPLRGAAESIAIPPDRIYTGTILFAAGLTGGDVTVTEREAARLEAVLELLVESGMSIERTNGILRARGRIRNAVTANTAMWPAYPTDLLPQTIASFTQASGRSVFTETVFNSRFAAVGALRALGARIDVDGNVASVFGPAPLHGVALSVADSGIRENASVLLAALAARGTTYISGAGAMGRGYEDLPGDLRRLGADIEKVEEAALHAS